LGGSQQLYQLCGELRELGSERSLFVGSELGREALVVFDPVAEALRMFEVVAEWLGFEGEDTGHQKQP
jgi:hypothetical protein